MKKQRLWVLLVGLTVVTGAAWWFVKSRGNDSVAAVLKEQAVTSVRLSGPLTKKKAEVSGLAWFGDNLIFLPQYPNFVKDSGDGFLYYLPKAEILAYLDGTSQVELEPRPIPLTASKIGQVVPNYQGFESIGFSGTQIFLTIEAGKGTDMQGYLISGYINPDLSSIHLDTTKLTPIQPQAASENHTDESMLVFDNQIVTFYEVNGEGIVAEPEAHVFDFALNPLETISMTNIEYRLTDTALSTNNEFWGINYFFSGDTELSTTLDSIVDTYGMGKTQSESDHIERLVKFNFSKQGITLADSPPIPFVLTEDARNWEGLAILDDRGFLVITDTHPDTIFGFVPLP